MHFTQSIFLMLAAVLASGQVDLNPRANQFGGPAFVFLADQGSKSEYNNIIEVRTTMILPSAPDLKTGGVAIWPGMMTWDPYRDFVQVVAAPSYEECRMLGGKCSCPAKKNQWCVFPYTFDCNLKGDCHPITRGTVSPDAGTHVQVHYIYALLSDNITQTITVGIRTLLEFSTTSGKGKYLTFTAECLWCSPLAMDA
jgi:hypothetical protein